MAEFTGRVLLAVGGFYQVAICDADRTLTCVLSGRLKQRGAGGRGRPVLPGDLVQLETVDDDNGVIRAVLPRTSMLVRPAIANVDTCVIVQAVSIPPPNFELIDRLLICARRAGLETVICCTKADQATEAEAEQLLSVYRAAGYTGVVTSARTGLGIDTLTCLLAGRISVLAGPSGVGKSRLLNALSPAFARRTGDISDRIKRGRHTTRQVELLPLPVGGYVADTPGFSALEFGELEARALPALYPEYARLAADCRFSGCLHRNEPGCAVVAAVQSGEVNKERYQRYLRFLEEIEENAARRY